MCQFSGASHFLNQYPGRVSLYGQSLPPQAEYFLACGRRDSGFSLSGRLRLFSPRLLACGNLKKLGCSPSLAKNKRAITTPLSIIANAKAER
jgi:hypothetical protein